MSESEPGASVPRDPDASAVRGVRRLAVVRAIGATAVRALRQAVVRAIGATAVRALQAVVCVRCLSAVRGALRRSRAGATSVPGAPVAVLCVALVVVAAAVSPVASARVVDGDGGGLTTAVDGEPVPVVVLFEDRDSVSERPVTALGGTVTGGRSVDVVPVLFARVPRAALDALRHQSGVRAVERDERVAAVPSYTVRDLSRTEAVPWGVERVGGRTAADVAPDGAAADVTVAVLDTGVDYDHEDLRDSVVWGVDVVGATTTYGVAAADDVNGHGTHVAGTVAARANGVGVVGVAPNASVYAVQVLGPDGGSVSDVVEGIDEALKGPDGEIGTDDDADVISMSLGGEVGTAAEREAVARATNLSVPVVTAAGNAGDGDPTTDDVVYPAKYDSSIAVGATDERDAVPTFSSRGSAVDVAAPGVGVRSTYPGDEYARFSGTSMATGHVSGAVALLLAQDAVDGSRDLSVEDVRARLAATARDLDPAGRDNASGAGLVRADRLARSAGLDPRLVANRSAVVVGDSVAFAVRQGDGGGSLPATVQVEDAIYPVNGSEARHRFDTAGRVVVTATVSTPAGYEYVRSATVTVSPGDVTGDGRVARDLDGDGTFEDVDGDGAVDRDDARALFVNRAHPTVREHPQAFDVTGDGSTDVVDVHWLYLETAATANESAA